MLLIIDNQSAYLRKFKRDYLDEHDVPHVIVGHDEPIPPAWLAGATGLLLSGGKGSPYAPLNLTTNFVAMMNLDVPTLGICLGHEILAVTHNGRIHRLPSYQRKKELVQIVEPDDPIFEGVEGSEVSLVKKHRYHVPILPHPLRVLARSAVCPVEVFRHPERPLYGFQGHPEVSGPGGLRIMGNFLGLCGLRPAGV